MKKGIRDLFGFLSAAVTPFHAVAECEKRLTAAGFRPLFEGEEWKTEPGKGYFVTRNRSSILAFRAPRGDLRGFMIAASHTDSPTLRVKTAPTAAQLEEFFKAHRDAYKVEGSLSAVVATVPAAEFAAQVNKSATKERLEKFFRDNPGLFAGKDGKQPAFDAVRGEVRKRFVALESLELAKRKAYDFASSIYEEMNEIPAEKRGADGQREQNGRCDHEDGERPRDEQQG